MSQSGDKVTSVFNKLVQNKLITTDNYTVSEFENWIKKPGNTDIIFKKLNDSKLINEPNYTVNDFNAWIKTDSIFTDQKVTVGGADSKVATRDNKQFKSQVEASLVDKFSMFGNNHDLVVTETNDLPLDTNGRMKHKSRDQREGKSFDVNFADRSMNADKIYNAVLDGKRHGLIMEYEVTNSDDYNKLIKQKPQLVDHIKIIPPGGNTKAHFSVYNDKGVVVDYSFNSTPKVDEKQKKITDITNRAYAKYNTDTKVNIFPASLGEQAVRAAGVLHRDKSHYLRNELDAAFKSGELNIADFSDVELNQIYGYSKELARKKELGTEETNAMSARMSGKGFANKAKNLVAGIFNTASGQVFAGSLGIDDVLEIKDNKVNILLRETEDNGINNQKMFLNKDEILNLTYHPASGSTNPNHPLNEHLAKIQGILTSGEQMNLEAETTGVSNRIRLQNERLNVLASNVEKRIGKKGLFEEIKELRAKETNKLITPEEKESLDLLMDTIVQYPEIKEINELQQSLNADNLKRTSIENKYSNAGKIALLKEKRVGENDVRRENLSKKAAIIEDVLFTGLRTVKNLSQIPKDVTRLAGVTTEALFDMVSPVPVGLDINATDSRIKQNYWEPQFVYGTNKEIPTFHNFVNVGDNKVIFSKGKASQVVKPNGFKELNPMVADSYLKQAQQKYDADNNILDWDYSPLGLLHGVEETAPDLINIFAVGGVFKALGTNAIKAAAATDRVSKTTSMITKMMDSSRIMEASSMVPVFVDKMMEDAIRSGGALTPGQLATATYANLTAEYLAERMFAGPTGKLLTAKQISRDRVKNIFERDVKNIFDNVLTGKVKAWDYMKELGKVGLELGKDLGGEGIEEAVIEIVQPAINRVLNNLVDTKYDSSNFDWTDVASSFAVGAAAGGLLGSVRAGKGVVTARKGINESYSDLIASAINGNLESVVGTATVKNPEAFKLQADKLLKNGSVTQDQYNKVVSAVEQASAKSSHLSEPVANTKIEDAEKQNKLNNLYRNIALNLELSTIDATDKRLNPEKIIDSLFRASELQTNLKELDVNLAWNINSSAIPSLINNSGKIKLSESEMIDLRQKHKEIAKSVSETNYSNLVKEKILELKLQKAKNDIISVRPVIEDTTKDEIKGESKILDNQIKREIKSQEKIQAISNLIQSYNNTEDSDVDIKYIDDNTVDVRVDDEVQLEKLSEDLAKSGIVIRNYSVNPKINKPPDPADPADPAASGSGGNPATSATPENQPVETQDNIQGDSKIDNTPKNDVQDIQQDDEEEDDQEDDDSLYYDPNVTDEEDFLDDGTPNPSYDKETGKVSSEGISVENVDEFGTKKRSSTRKGKLPANSFISDVKDNNQDTNVITQPLTTHGRLAINFFNNALGIKDISAQGYLEYLQNFIYPKFLKLLNPFTLRKSNGDFNKFSVFFGKYPTVNIVPSGFSKDILLIGYKDSKGNAVSKFAKQDTLNISDLKDYFKKNSILNITYSLYGIEYDFNFILSDFLHLATDVLPSTSASDVINLRSTTNATYDKVLPNRPKISEIRSAIAEIKKEFTEMQSLRKFVVARLNNKLPVTGTIDGTGGQYIKYIKGREVRQRNPSQYSKSRMVYPLSMFSDNGMQEIPILLSPVVEDGKTIQRLYVNGQVQSIVINTKTTKDNYKPSFAYPNNVRSDGTVEYATLPLQNRKLGAVTIKNGENITPVAIEYSEYTQNGEIRRNVKNDSENIIHTIKLLVKNYIAPDELTADEKNVVNQLGIPNTRDGIVNYIKQFIDIDIANNPVHETMNKSGLIFNAGFVKAVNNEAETTKNSSAKKGTWSPNMDVELDAGLRDMYFRVDYDKLLSEDDTVKIIKTNNTITEESYRRLAFDNIYADFDIAVNSDSNLQFDNQTLGHRLYSPVANQRIFFTLDTYTAENPIPKTEGTNILENATPKVEVKKIRKSTQSNPVQNDGKQKVVKTETKVRKSTKKVDPNPNVQDIKDSNNEEVKDVKNLDIVVDDSNLESIDGDIGKTNNIVKDVDSNTTGEANKEVNPNDLAELFYETVGSEETQTIVIETPKNKPGLPQKFINDAVNSIMGMISEMINYDTGKLKESDYTNKINNKVYKSYLDAIATIKEVLLPKVIASNNEKFITKYSKLLEHLTLLTNNWSVVQDIVNEEFKLITGENLEYETLDDQADEDRVIKANQKKKIRKNVKLLLRAIPKTDRKNNTTRNISSIITASNDIKQYESLDKVMDLLLSMLSISNNRYYEPTIDNIIEILKENTLKYPWLSILIDKLETNPNIRSEFLRSFYNVDANYQKLIFTDQNSVSVTTDSNNNEVEIETTYTKLIANQANFKKVASKIVNIWREYVLGTYSTASGEIKIDINSNKGQLLSSYVALFFDKALITDKGLVNKKLLDSVKELTPEIKQLLSDSINSIDELLKTKFPIVGRNTSNVITDRTEYVNKLLAQKILASVGINITDDILAKIENPDYILQIGNRKINYDLNNLFTLVNDFKKNDFNTLKAGTFNPVNIFNKASYELLANYLYQYDDTIEITPDTAFRDGSLQIQVYQIPRLFYIKMSKLVNKATNLIYNLTNDRNGKKHFASNSYWKNLILAGKLSYSSASLQVIEQIDKPNSEKDIHKFSEKKLLESITSFFLGNITSFSNSLQSKNKPTMRLFGKSLSDSKFMTFFEMPKLDFIGDLRDVKNLLELDVPQENGSIVKQKVPILEFLMNQLIQSEAHRILNTDPTGLREYNKDYFYNIPEINSLADTYGISIQELAKYLVEFKPGSSIDELSYRHGIYSSAENILLNFINEESEKLAELFDLYRIGYSNTNGDKLWNMVSKEAVEYYFNRLTDPTPESVHYAIIQDIVTNYLISNVNSSMLVYGDPALYSKFNNIDATLSNMIKRLKSFSSPKEMLDLDMFTKLTGKSTINYLVIEDVKGMSGNIQYLSRILDGKEITEEEIKQYKDPKTSLEDKSKILAKYPISSPYFNTNQADGQEFVHWKHHLATLVALGELSEVKYNKLVKVITDTPHDLFNDFDEVNKDSSDYLSTSEIRQVFAPFKPLYTGQVLDGPVEKQYYIKSSHIALLPTFSGGLEPLISFMETHKTDRLSFESAVKLGIHNTVSLFNVKMMVDVSKVAKKAIKLSTLILPVENYGKQLHNPTDKENLVTLSTQAQKGMFANIKNEIVKYKGVNIKVSTLEKIRNNYHRQAQLLLKNKLYESLGIINQSDSIDIEKLVELMNDEILSGRYDDNVKQSIAINKSKNKFTIPIWLRSNPGAIESIIANIINKAGISRIKRPGVGFVQASGLGQKVVTADFDKYTNNIVYTDSYDRSKGLQHAVENKNGQIVSQIIVPWLFKDAISRYVYSDTGRLDMSRIPEELLTILGYRIPNQHHPSMIALEIVGFLPKAMGNVTIVPTEIVTQMGADFDVDKLYSYIKAIDKSNAKNRVELIKRKREINNAVKEIYDNAPDIIKETYEKYQNFLKEEGIFRKNNPRDKWNPVNTALYEGLLEKLRERNLIDYQIDKTYNMELSKDPLETLWNNVLDTELAVISSNNTTIQKSVRMILDGPMKQLKLVAQDIDDLKKNTGNKSSADSHASLSFNVDKYIGGSQAKDILGTSSLTLVFNFLTQNTNFSDATEIKVNIIDDTVDGKITITENQVNFGTPYTSKTLAQLEKTFPKYKDHVFVENLTDGTYRLISKDQMTPDELAAMQDKITRNNLAQEFSDRFGIRVEWKEVIADDEITDNIFANIKSDIVAAKDKLVFALKLNSLNLYSVGGTYNNVITFDKDAFDNKFKKDKRRGPLELQMLNVARSLQQRVEKESKGNFTAVLEGTGADITLTIKSTLNFRKELYRKYNKPFDQDLYKNQDVNFENDDLFDGDNIIDKLTDTNGNEIAGYYDPSTNTVVLTESASQETIIHEFLHPFIEEYKIYNPEGYDKLYNDAWQILGNEEVDRVIALYPEEKLQSEIIVRAMAKIGSQNIDPVTGKNFIDKVIDFFNWLKDIIYRDIAFKMFNGDTLTSKDISTIENIQHLADIFTIYKGKIELTGVTTNLNKGVNNKLAPEVVEQIDDTQNNDTKNTEVIFAEQADPVRNLEQELIDGFLKDFNITVTEYNSIKEDLGFDAYTMSDLVTKDIAVEQGQSILPEVVYFAYAMLGKENDKLRSDLKYLVKLWSKYDERFKHHKDIISKREGFIADSRKWRTKIQDLVILDFLQDKLKDYYENPTEFQKRTDVKWTNDDFTRWEKFIRKIEEFLNKFSLSLKSNKEKLKTLENIGSSIASELLDRNYEYFNFNISEDQIQKYYKNTIESDPFAKELVEFGQSLKMVLTGSLALRRAGTVYRTIKETLHDIDWVIPFELISQETNDKTLNSIQKYQGNDTDYASAMALSYVEDFEWFKKFKEKYPSYELTNGYYGKEHNNFESFTVQGVINGEFYTESGTHEEEVSFYKKDPITKKSTKVTETREVKHTKGDLIKETGYAIDFFIRLKPNQEEHENYFKLWKEIIIAKLKMGRAKDFTDWKAFTPYLKSNDDYNFKYEGFRHINWKEDNQNNLLEDDILYAEENQPDTQNGVVYAEDPEYSEYLESKGYEYIGHQDTEFGSLPAYKLPETLTATGLPVLEISTPVKSKKLEYTAYSSDLNRRITKSGYKLTIPEFPDAEIYITNEGVPDNAVEGTTKSNYKFKEWHIDVVHPKGLRTFPTPDATTISEVIAKFTNDINLKYSKSERTLQILKEIGIDLIPSSEKEYTSENSGEREYTPENITSLKPNEVFVFGSNPLGINGNPEKYPNMSASRATANGWVEQGEKIDNRLSDSGKAWGITTVTKPGAKKSKTPEEIGKGIQDMLLYAKEHPKLKFLVTKFGTENAGWDVPTIKSLFEKLKNFIPDNVILPKEFEVRNDENVNIEQLALSFEGKYLKDAVEQPTSEPRKINRDIKVNPVNNNFNTYVKNLNEGIIKENNLAKDIEYKTSTVTGMQTAAVDNINEDDILSKINLTRETSTFAMILATQGFTIDQIPYILAQPVIIDYIKELKRKGRGFEYNSSLLEDSLKNVLDKYSIFDYRDSNKVTDKVFNFKMSQLKKTISNPFILKSTRLSVEERIDLNAQLFDLLNMFITYESSYKSFMSIVDSTNINTNGGGKDMYSIYNKIKSITDLLESKAWENVYELYQNGVHTTSIDILIDIYNKFAEKDLGISIIHHQNDIENVLDKTVDDNIFTRTLGVIKSYANQFNISLTPYLETKLFETIRDISKAYVYSNIVSSIYNAGNSRLKDSNEIREELIRGTRTKPPLYKIIFNVKNKKYETIAPAINNDNGIDQNPDSVRISNNSFINLLTHRTIEESRDPNSGLVNKSTTYIVTNSSADSKLNINDVHADVIDLFNNPITLDGDYTTKDMILDLLLYSFSIGHKQTQGSFTKFIPESLVQEILQNDGNLDYNYQKLNDIVYDNDLLNTFVKNIYTYIDELVPNIPKNFTDKNGKKVSVFIREDSKPFVLTLNDRTRENKLVTGMLYKKTELDEIIHYPVIKYNGKLYEYDSNQNIYILMNYMSAKKEYGIYINDDLSKSRRVSNTVVSQSKTVEQDTDVKSVPVKKTELLINELNRMIASNDPAIRNQAILLKELLNNAGIDDITIEYVDKIENPNNPKSQLYGSVLADPKDKTIKISREINNKKGEYPYHKILHHEVGHIITRDVIGRYLNFRNNPNGKAENYGLSVQELKVLDRLNNNYKAFRNLKEADSVSLKVNNLHEFVTEVLANDEFRKFIDNKFKISILDRIHAFFKAIIDNLLGKDHPYLMYSDLIIGDIMTLSTENTYMVMKYTKPNAPSYIIRTIGKVIISITKETIDPKTGEINLDQLVNTHQYEKILKNGYTREKNIIQNKYKDENKQIVLEQFQDAIGTVVEDVLSGRLLQLNGTEIPKDSLPYMLAAEAVSEEHNSDEIDNQLNDDGSINHDKLKIEYTKSLSWFKVKTSSIKYKKVFELFNTKLDKISKKIKSKQEEIERIKRKKNQNVFNEINRINKEIAILNTEFTKTLANLNVVAKLTTVSELYKFYAGLELDMINILNKSVLSYAEANYIKRIIDDIEDKLNVNSNSYVLGEAEIANLRLTIGDAKTEELIDDFSRLKGRLSTIYIPKLIKHQRKLIISSLNPTLQKDFTEEKFYDLVDQELKDITTVEKNLLGTDRTTDQLTNAVINKLLQINQESMTATSEYNMTLNDLWNKAAFKLKKYLKKDAKFSISSPLLDSFGNFISDYTDAFYDSQNKMLASFKEAMSSATTYSAKSKAYKMKNDWISKNKVAFNPQYVLDEQELIDLGLPYAKDATFDEKKRKHQDYLKATMGSYKYDYVVDSVRKAVVDYIKDRNEQKALLKQAIGKSVSIGVDPNTQQEVFVKFTKDDANKALIEWTLKYNPINAALYNYNGKSVIAQLSKIYGVPKSEIRISDKYVKMVPRRFTGVKSLYEKTGDNGFYNPVMQEFYKNNEKEIIDFIEHANDLLYKRDSLIPDEKKYNVSSRNIMYMEKELWDRFIHDPITFKGLVKSRFKLFRDYFKSLSAFTVPDKYQEFDPDYVSNHIGDDNILKIKQIIDVRISKFYNNSVNIRQTIREYSQIKYQNTNQYYPDVYKRIKQEVYDEVNNYRSFDLVKALSLLSAQVHDYEVKTQHSDEVGTLSNFLIDRYKTKGLSVVNNKIQQDIEGDKRKEAINRIESFMNFLDNFHKRQRDIPSDFFSAGGKLRNKLLGKSYTELEKKLLKELRDHREVINTRLEKFNNSYSSTDIAANDDLQATQEKLENKIEALDSDIERLGKDTYLAEFLAIPLMQATQLLGLGWSIMGHITNLAAGQFANAQEARDSRIYDKKSLGESITDFKKGSGAFKYTIAVGGVLAGAVFSPSITMGLIAGTISGITIAGIYQKIANLKNNKANENVDKLFKFIDNNNIMSRIKNEVNTDKYILNKYPKLLSNDANKSTMGNLISNYLSVYRGTDAAEEQNQGIAVMSYLRSRYIKDINGNDISLLDALDNTGHFANNIPETVEYFNKTHTKDELTKLISVEAANLIAKNQGNYMEILRPAIFKTVVGKAALQFKRWMIELNMLDFQSEQQDHGITDREGKTLLRKGRVTTLIEKAGLPITSLIFATNILLPFFLAAAVSGQFLAITGSLGLVGMFGYNLYKKRNDIDRVDGIGSEILKSISRPFIDKLPIINRINKNSQQRDYFSNLIGQDFNEADAGNMRALMFKMRVNIVLLTAYTALNIVLQGAKDDDDEERKRRSKQKSTRVDEGSEGAINNPVKKGAYLLLNILGKMYTDHNLTLDPKATGERFSALKGIVPMIGTFIKLWDATINPSYFGKEYEKNDAKRGIKAGDLKTVQKIKKATVGLNKIEQIESAMEAKQPIFDISQ